MSSRGHVASLRELERALDAFMASHVAAAVILASRSSQDESDLQDSTAARQDGTTTHDDMTVFHRDLRRLQWLSCVFSSGQVSSNAVGVGETLLGWLQAVESSSAAVAASAAVDAMASPLNAAEAALKAQHESAAGPVASWLVATLLRPLLEALEAEKLAVRATDCSLRAFQRAWEVHDDAQRRARAEAAAGGFFAFTQHLTLRGRLKLPRSEIPVLLLAQCEACTIKAAIAWSHVLALAASRWPENVRPRLQRELQTRSTLWGANKPIAGTLHAYLRHLKPLRLELETTKLPETARWLRALLPLLLKPQRSHVRAAAALLVAEALRRELSALETRECSALYASTGGDWSRCVSELHAAALRLTDCAKRKSRSLSQQQLETAAWALRVGVLALAPRELFARYWREDTLALLRLQYQLNQDASGSSSAFAMLPSLEHSFTQLLERHRLETASGSAPGTPSETDCMEIINTTQAWVFFSLPRLRPRATGSSISLGAFLATALPALVRMSRVIARYNTAYAIQSHLRRLLAEPSGVGDPQKLVGLEALLDLLRCSCEDAEEDVDRSAILAAKPLLGELVGRVLVECSTRMGHELLDGVNNDNYAAEDDDGDKDPVRAVAVATFAVALRLLPDLYAHLTPSDDQKLLLLVRASVHAGRRVRHSACETLLVLASSSTETSATSPAPGAATIVRALTDYIMRISVCCTAATNSGIPSSVTLLRVLSALLSPERALVTRWESARAQLEALTQTEAVCVYLLAGIDGDAQATKLLRLTTLETLQVAHEARFLVSAGRNTSLVPLAGRPSVLTLLDGLEAQLQTAFYTFHAPPGPSEIDRPLPVLRWLIEDTTGSIDTAENAEHSSFRWSEVLGRIFPTLAMRASDVTAYIWRDVADKVAQLEPAVAIMPVPTGDSPQIQSRQELACWRNLALLATATACSTSSTQTRKLEIPVFPSATSSFSSVASSSVATSVIPTATVAALVRQLACYLRSSCADQRKAAVLALGHASNTTLAVLLDALARLEMEAFATPNREHALSAGSPSTLGRRSRSSKSLKLSRKKILELQRTQAAQLQLLWALGRCYRLLLESRQPDETHEATLESTDSSVYERLRRMSWGFLGKMVAVLDTAMVTSTFEMNFNPIYFMAQQDFSASLQVLLQSRSASSVSLSVSSKQSPLPAFNKLTDLLLHCCGSFSERVEDATLSVLLQTGTESSAGDSSAWTWHCNVHAICNGEVTSAWLWLDSSLPLGDDAQNNRPPRNLLQYFACVRAFSALVALLRSSLETPGDNCDIGAESANVVAWLDKCFSLNSIEFPHLCALRQLARRALNALLVLPSPGSVRSRRAVSLCLTKAENAFVTPESTIEPRMRVAQEYLAALGNAVEVMGYFRSLLQRLEKTTGDGDDTTLAVRLLHVVLLHVEAASEAGMHQNQYQHRQSLLDMVASLVCSTDKESEIDDDTATARWGLQEYYSPATAAARLQVSVSALLAGRFPSLGLRMSLVMLRSISQGLKSGVSSQQQRQILVTVLPWLAEVSLGALHSPSELLGVTFELTEALRERCNEQLDHVWLTLAFARGDGNLGTIVAFLFSQQRCQQTQQTAKTVLWWLCRWQDAAPDVLHALLLQPQSRVGTALSALDGTAKCSPLQDMASLVALASYSSSQLIQPGATWSSGPVRALAVQLMHAALSTLFALLGDADLSSEPVIRDCHTLLHDVLPLLEAPRGLLASALAEIRAATTSTSYHEALRTLASCLSTAETELWSELCVRDIALAIASESCEASTKLTRPAEFCVRFALVVYARLETQFQGDVLLSTLALLRQALDAQDEERQQWSWHAQMLTKECLVLLSTLTRRMPAAQLLLYPQVLWVALALLAHCRQQTTESMGTLHDDALGLLEALLGRVVLVRHAVMQDLLRYTRPAQWAVANPRSSVLMELVRSVHTSGLSSRGQMLALAVLRNAVLLIPRDLLGVSSCEHLVICTLGLLPILADPSKSVEKREHDERDRTWNDLAELWRAAGSGKACDQLVELFRDQGFECSEVANGRELAAKFAAAFVPSIRAFEQAHKGFDGLGLSLDVLGSILPEPLANPADRPQLDEEAAGGDWTFLQLEELLRAVQRSADATQKAWRPASELEAVLARLLRHPRSEHQWRATVRILGCLADMASPDSAIRSPSSSPTHKPGLLMDSEGIKGTRGAAPIHSVKNTPPQSTTTSSTLKKTPPTRSLMQFMTSRSRSISAISKSFRSDANSGNKSDASLSLETTRNKEQYPSEPSEDLDLRPPPNNDRISETE